MDLNDMVMFARVVESNSFAEAARVLGLPRSTLSRRIQQLEKDLGARLLHRTTRHVSLTESGRVLYDYCASMAATAEQAAHAVLDFQEQPRGLLRISIPKTPAALFLGRWLSEFQQAYPQISLQVMVTDQYVNLVESSLDVAIRVGPLADSALVARPIGTTKRLLVAGEKYLRDRTSPQSPDDLTDHACIGFASPAGVQPWTLHNGDQRTRLDLPWALQVDDMATLYQMVLAGSGIALMPELVCYEALADGRIYRVCEPWQGNEAQFFLVYPERRYLPRKVQVLIEFIQHKVVLERNVFGSLPGENLTSPPSASAS